jgi:WD40 repeat protein
VQSLADLENVAVRNRPKALEDADRIASPVDAHELLIHTAGLPDDSIATIASWLEHGPPLLVFVDLNEIPSDVSRLALARSLAAFQGEWAGWHRCIVTYRSSQQGQGVLKVLAEPLFRHYNMATIQPDQAVRYLRNYRLFEQRIDQEEGQSQSDRDVDAECAKLKEFLDRHVRGGESLISTPLIMHLVSLLDAGQISAVETLADLYRKVTDKLLEDQEERRTQDPELTRQVRTALVRVALAIQSLGPDATSLPAGRFDALMQRPESGKRDRVMRWQPPEGSLWLERVADKLHPYYEEPLARDESRLREYALFRSNPENRAPSTDGGQVLSYLHDSFLYHFQAVALRDYLGWGQPPETEDLDPRWFSAVALRIKMHPERWALAMEFLGGLLTAEEFEALSLELLLVESVSSAWIDLLMRLARGASARSQLADEIHRVLLRRMTTIRPYPRAFAAQCYAMLKDSRVNSAAAFAQTLRVHLVEEGRFWLRLHRGTLTPTDQIFTGHDGEVRSVAELPDGRIVSGSADKTVRIWDLNTGDEIFRCEHDDVVTVVAVLDSDRIVTGSEDRTVRTWDVNTGLEISRVHHDGAVTSLVLLEGGRILTGSDDGTVRIWDLNSGQEIFRGRHAGPVKAVAALDHSRVVSGSSDRTIRVWDVNSSREVFSGLHEDWIRAVAVLGPRSVVSASDDHTVRVWDVNTGKQVFCGRHDGRVNDVAVVDDCRILSGSADWTVRIWDVNGGTELFRVRHDNWVNLVAVFDPSSVISAADDYTVRIWDIRTGAELFRGRHDDWVIAMSVLAKGRILSGSWDKTVRIWDVRAGVESVRSPHVDLIRSVAVWDQDRVLTGSWDRTLRIWDLCTGAEVFQARHDDRIHAVAVVDQDRVVSGSADNTTRVWDVNTGAEIFRGDHDERIWAVAAVDHDQVLSGSTDRTVRMWDVRTGAEIFRGHHDGRILAVAAMDHDRFISGSADRTVRVWDLSTAAEIFRGDHDDTVWAVAVLDHDRIFSGSEDGTVRVWDLSTGAEVFRGHHDDLVWAVAMVDIDRVISSSEDRTVRVWNVSDSKHGKAGELFTLALTGVVGSIAVDRKRWFIFTPLRDGRVLSWAIEPEASRTLSGEERYERSSSPTGTGGS